MSTKLGINQESSRRTREELFVWASGQRMEKDPMVHEESTKHEETSIIPMLSPPPSDCCNYSNRSNKNKHNKRSSASVLVTHQAEGDDDEDAVQTAACPSCGHQIQTQDEGRIIQELPGLPAGVKFDPNDHEILEHLEAKVLSDTRKPHPLIDQFIPTLEGENGICYTHPERLPGVSKDGFIRHFFHRPSKAYTTGTRKRRKVHTDEDGGETRWHKTGKTRAVLGTRGAAVKGFKKILVLYTNYGRQRKPEKTNWVIHQYHLGHSEEEREGELVVSKVFYQTQPRHCSASSNSASSSSVMGTAGAQEQYYNNVPT